jgi:DNA invertase Pin-like site-specific DNA recombinase
VRQCLPIAERPGGWRVLELLANHQAGGLVVAKMDRLTGGIKDFVGLHDQAQAGRWALVMLDVDLDTSTPTGEFTANIRASAAQFEHRLIGQRTREALAQKRAQGIKLGRPPEIDPAPEEFIVTRRRAGLPLRAIAQELNTAGGYAWYVFSTVRRVLSRHEVPPFRTQTAKASYGRREAEGLVAAAALASRVSLERIGEGLKPLTMR